MPTPADSTPAAPDERKRISTTVSPRTLAAIEALSRKWDDLPLGRVLDRLLAEDSTPAQNTAASGTE